jgi:hypothetical protein
VLRPLESFVADHEGQEVLVLRDPAGWVGDPVALSPAAGLLLEAFDGTRDADAIAEEVRKRHRIQVSGDVVRELVAGLDQLGLLWSPAFEARKGTANDAYRAAGHRPARFAGESYPDDADALARGLEAQYANLPSRGDEPVPERLDGVIAPHIDLRVCGPTYAEAYRAFREGSEAPDAFVVFGTCHLPVDELFTASRLDYATPLGPVPVDGDLLDALARGYGRERLFANEALHALEHTVEFQAVHLRFIFGEKVPPMIPILTGSLEFGRGDPADDPDVTRFLDVLSAAAREQGKRLCAVAGADLAHMGPRFDDPEMVDEPFLARLRRRDEATLSHVDAGDPAALHRDVTAGGNDRRICGLTPMYMTMRWAGSRPGRVRHYHQWLEEGSVVSFAAAEIEGARG